MRRWGAVLAACSTALTFVGCREQAKPRLEHVPHPGGIDQLEPAVRTQILDAYSAVEIARERATGPQWTIRLAHAYGRLGMVLHAYDTVNLTDLATTCYRNASLLEPDSSRWSSLLGMAHEGVGNLSAALDAFEEAVRSDPDDVGARFRLASMLLEKGSLDRAMENAEKVVERDPDHVGAIALMARVHLVDNQPEDAVALCQRGLRLQPDATPLISLLAQAHRARGDVEASARCLARIPTDNRFKTPIAIPDPLRDVLSKLRVDSQQHVHRAMRALNDGKTALAALEFRQALAVDPTRVSTRYGLARALVAGGDIDGGLTQLDRILSEQPSHLEARLLRIRGLVAQTRLPEALQEATAASAAFPHDPRPMVWRGRVLRASGDLEAASEMFELAVSLEPTDSDAVLEAAVTRIRRNHLRGAADLLERGRTADPEARVIRHLLERLYSAGQSPVGRQGPESAVLIEARGGPMTVFDVETFAMAEAAAGRFGVAERLQSIALAHVARASSDHTRCRRRLQLYRTGHRSESPLDAGEDLSGPHVPAAELDWFRALRRDDVDGSARRAEDTRQEEPRS